MTGRTFKIMARWVFTALTALCLTGWAMSYFVCPEVLAMRDLSHCLDLGAQRGSIVFVSTSIADVGMYGTGFVPGVCFAHSPPGALPVTPNRLGFRQTSVEFRGRRDDWVIVPFWIVTAIPGLIAWLLWRKPRPRNSAMAFPVLLDNSMGVGVQGQKSA